MEMIAVAQPLSQAEQMEQVGRYRDAEPLRRVAFERARLSKRDSVELADLAEKLADNLAMQIRLVEAEPLYRLALDIRLKRRGEMHGETARSLRQLSALLMARGSHAEARPIAERSLAIQRAVSPTGDVEIAWALNNLAQIGAAAGKPFESDGLFREAIGIARAAGDEDALAVLLNNRGINFYRMAVARQIPPAFRRRAGAMRGVVVPTDDEEDGDEDAGDSDRKRLLGEGRTALREALALAVKRFGQRHPDIANLLNSLAANHRAAGELIAAERLYREAAAIKAEFLLPEDRDRIVGAWSLGAVLAQLPGRAGEARAQFRAAASGALAAQTRHREFDRAAVAELRSYAPIFMGQVRVSWTLANTP
jgi:tetratricopeptide (TPR) repeat protein